MFDVTPDEISQLNDVDLRELVGRLCEAELVAHGLSPAAVTWGGNQTAPDGGLDVRVALPFGSAVDGFVPRSSTGFQVKLPDMPRAAIIAEMQPAGTIRPVIQELADEAGAYIIVSSKGSTADGPLQSRQKAMRDALKELGNSTHLHTDFYDRRRLASWVQRHPGLISWVKARVGRPLVGWRPFGAWSGAPEGVDGEYLLDNKLRLHFSTHGDQPTRSLVDAIDELRDGLAQPRKMVRLVGLSGVGKTRLVQALFDSRVGTRPLLPSLAVYTNLSDNPDPQPVGLASDLNANRTRAILVVDNCPPDLHRRLSEQCLALESNVRCLTIEYDVREDQPEGTEVVTLEGSSPDLIIKLIERRYPHISQVSLHTISEMAGGNARIAIALAGTVKGHEVISALTDDELFQRLFRQRHDASDALLQAAQACSLVYSFQGEALGGSEAELPRLASLARQSTDEIYGHVREIVDRDLAQEQGVWRAVLPPAIANRLASRALDRIPYEHIDEHIIYGGTDRLTRSFSRRLSFLHENRRAISIVGRWLSPGGLLGDVNALTDLGRAMFHNVAPVLPEAALAALERAGDGSISELTLGWQQHLSLLRSLAYEPDLFERSALMLARAASQNKDERQSKSAKDIFTSLFSLYLSGTHATIEQRLSVIEHLLQSSDPIQHSLGLAALEKVLEAIHFSSAHHFAFGSRSRDYGYQPNSHDDVVRWYCAALDLLQRLALTGGELERKLRTVLAQKFRGLWAWAQMYDELDCLERF